MFVIAFIRYGDSVDRLEENVSVFSLISECAGCGHLTGAVSKGMPAVKLCTNKIIQFLTGGAG